jgi:hypothetical protein
LVGGALLWSVAGSMAVFPHSGSYFNELAGGPRGGADHFVMSNVGWGQDLLFLKRWAEAHPEARPLGLVYYGNLDPRLAGLEFELPPPGPRSANFPCGRKPVQQGPQPGWFAVDVSFVRGMSHQLFDGRGRRFLPDDRNCDYSYFSRFVPVGRVGGSILIYHITLANASHLRDELGLADFKTPELAPNNVKGG